MTCSRMLRVTAELSWDFQPHLVVRHALIQPVIFAPLFAALLTSVIVRPNSLAAAFAAATLPSTTHEKATFWCYRVHSPGTVLASTTFVGSIQTPAFHSLYSCLSSHLFPDKSCHQITRIFPTPSGQISVKFLRVFCGAVRVSSH